MFMVNYYMCFKGRESREKLAMGCMVWGSNPVGARTSAPVQIGPGSHPASYTMRTGWLPEVNRPVRGIDHSPLQSVEVKGKLKLYVYSPSGPSWPFLRWILLHVFHDPALFLQLAVWLLCQHITNTTMQYMYCSWITSNLHTDYVVVKSVRHNLKFRNVPYKYLSHDVYRT
jgi:hypothetical protein